MPAGRLDEDSPVEAVTSHVEESLTRLHGSLRQAQRQEQEADGRFARWQQWVSKQGRRIARHLERIEHELAEPSAVDDVRVSLSIVGSSFDLEPNADIETL